MSPATPAREVSFRTAIGAAIGCGICIAFGLIPLFMGLFPVFLQPVSKDMGWGLSVFPQAPMIIGITAAFTGPVLGRLIDRYGVRRLLPAGLALWSAGYFALSLMSGSVMQLYLIAIAIGLGGTVCGPIAYAKVINGWFDRNRGLALGVVLSGVPAIATALAVPVSQLMIDHHGWRHAVQLLAIVAASISIPASLLLVREAAPATDADRPIAAGEGFTGSQAYRSRTFFLVVGASSLAVGASSGISAHFLAWMGERGVSKDTATLGLSLYSLVGPLGPLIGGILVDRIQSPKLICTFFAAPAVGIGLLSYAGTQGIVPGMMLLGLAFCSINGLAPYLVSRYFGMKSISEILGVTFAALTIGMGLGPVLVGAWHDHSGGYSQPVAIAGIVVVLALIGAVSFPSYRFGAPPVR